MASGPARRDVLADPAARRVLLAACAGLLLTLPVIAHDSLNGRLVYGWIAVVIGIAGAVAVLRRRTRVNRRVALVAGAICLAMSISTLVLLASTLASPNPNLYCRDDVSSATFGGADEVRAGHNPYASYDTLAVEQGHGCGNPAATILRRGRFAGATGMPPESAIRAAVRDALQNPAAPEVERHLNYPGGTVLLGVVGTTAFPFVMAAVLVAAGAFAVRRATVDRRVVAAGLTAQVALLSLVPDGHTDAVVVALLLVAWASPTTVMGGLALGLACGTTRSPSSRDQPTSVRLGGQRLPEPCR